jgi:hypothetical protein
LNVFFLVIFPISLVPVLAKSDCFEFMQCVGFPPGRGNGADVFVEQQIDLVQRPTPKLRQEDWVCSASIPDVTHVPNTNTDPLTVCPHSCGECDGAVDESNFGGEIGVRSVQQVWQGERHNKATKNRVSSAVFTERAPDTHLVTVLTHAAVLTVLSRSLCSGTSVVVTQLSGPIPIP